MSDHLVTAMASTSLAAQSPPPPRVNFPIPQELRDEYGCTKVCRLITPADRDRIYEYLLSSKIVCNGMRYHFNTEIFGINKTIKLEAEEWLYKHNIFVVVSYKWPTQGPSSQDLLSIIPRLSTTKERVQQMKHYSLHIHITRSPCRGEKHMDRLVPLDRRIEDASLKWMLILEEDLDVFAAVFGLLLQGLHGKTVVIGGKSPDTSLTVRKRALFSSHSVHFKLMDRKYRNMNSELQHRLFDGLQDMLVGESMKVNFSSSGCAVEPHLAARLKASMGPQVIWTQARMGWMMINFRKVKWACDTDVQDGNEERAFYGLLALARWTTDLLDPVGNTFPGPRVQSDVQVILGIRVYDCLVSIAWLAMRLNKLTIFKEVMTQLVNTVMMNHEILRGVCYWTWLAGHHMNQLYCTLLDPLTWPAGFTIRQVIESVAMDSEHKQGEYLTHDIKVLREHADLDKAPSSDTLPLERCSIRTMKPCTKLFMSLGTGDPPYDGTVPRLPKGYVGWVDLDHIGEMTTEYKESISNTQKSNGLEVTDLDAVARDIKRVRFSWEDWKI